MGVKITTDPCTRHGAHGGYVTQDDTLPFSDGGVFVFRQTLSPQSVLVLFCVVCVLDRPLTCSLALSLCFSLWSIISVISFGSDSGQTGKEILLYYVTRDVRALCTLLMRCVG